MPAMYASGSLHLSVQRAPTTGPVLWFRCVEPLDRAHGQEAEDEQCQEPNGREKSDAVRRRETVSFLSPRAYGSRREERPAQVPVIAVTTALAGAVAEELKEDGICQSDACDRRPRDAQRYSRKWVPDWPLPWHGQQSTLARTAGWGRPGMQMCPLATPHAATRTAPMCR